MAVEIKFDANQQYQRDAINSVVDLFAGQEAIEQGAVALGLRAATGALEGFEELAFGNSLSLDPVTIEANLRRVQDRPVLQRDGTSTTAVPEGERRESAAGDAGMDFSVEMETGTGKTYVYLRTIAELRQKYGFTKFVIVVPSVAIREGVLSNLALLREHIRDVYDGIQYDAYVYDSRHPNRLRQFATSSHLQILVINIDSFTKETNLINRPIDAMNGYAPIDFLRACRPIVVMDEPQNMETPIRQGAIRSLAPLCRLRYSATHRDLRHLVYRLTPVDAYDLRLVKRVGVLSVTKDADLNEAHVEISRINGTPVGVTATARIYKATKQGTRLTRVTLRKDDDLFDLSGGREPYRGWTVEDIHTARDGAPGLVEFGNGVPVPAGKGLGGALDQQQRLMIRHAIEQHFEKELQLRHRRRRRVLPATIKPLTLFFIDRVSNYHPPDGKFRVWFEEEYEAVKADGRFRTLHEGMPDVAAVHDGYFATSAKGVPKDIRSEKDLEGAGDAFKRIMRNKERLLSFDEPLRFIFSHSALVEGWDNPNVFTICNLQEGSAEMRRRQQIGRGLRLPVMENGERCHVDDINLLTVIAHEPFAEFAAALQTEIEEETGVSFTDRLVNLKTDRIKLTLKEQVLEDPIFRRLWDRISRRTTYRLQFEADDVVAESVRRINEMEPLEAIQFRISHTEIDLTAAGVGTAANRDSGAIAVEGKRRLPDVVGELTRRVPLSRATIVRILRTIDNPEQVTLNPSVFIDRVAAAMNAALYDQVADGIVYTPDGEQWTAEQFKAAHQEETVAKPEFVVSVMKSITDKVVCDSYVELAFAEFLEERGDVPLFLKLPGWFLVPTPLGNYNPDWAIVRHEPDGAYLYLVRETKGTDQIGSLQWETEGWKIKFGAAHFQALGVDFTFGSSPATLIEASGA
jgi:type III restriction enzyme